MFTSRGPFLHSSVVYAVSQMPDICRLARYGDLKMIKKLANNGADIHVNQEAPLRLAARFGHIDVVRWLIENGADVRARNNESLLNAIHIDRLDIIYELSCYGATLDGITNDALRNSIINCTAKTVRYIVDCYGMSRLYDTSILYDFVYADNVDVVDVLLSNGADVQDNDDELLCESINRGQLEMVRMLIKHGADVNARSSKPLKNVLKKHDTAIAELLFANGVTIPMDIEMDHVFMANDLPMMKVLVANGLDISRANSWPLWMIMMLGCCEIIHYLLTLGMRITNEKYISRAIDFNSTDVLRLLVKYGHWHNRLNPYDYLNELNESHLPMLGEKYPEIVKIIKNRACRQYTMNMADVIIIVE